MVVGIDLHQVAILHVAVEASDGKVRVKGQLFDGIGVLEQHNYTKSKLLHFSSHKINM